MPPMFGPSAEKRASAEHEVYLHQRRTILLVDEDLGFVSWLGSVLAEAGYQTVPATSCREALSWIKKLNGSLSAVIGNRAMPGGHGFFETLGNLPGRLDTVLICDPGTDFLALDPREAVLEKPRAGDAISRQTWRRTVEQALSQAATEAPTRHGKKSVGN